MSVDDPTPQDPKAGKGKGTDSMIRDAAQDDNLNRTDTAGWNLPKALRAKRVQEIKTKLMEGAYFIPVGKLAAILTRIFMSGGDAPKDPPNSTN